MFSNVVATQDLLSDSQRSSYSNDSALFSLSQRQSHSQSDFSQVRTQDMFTQKLTGSQSENSFGAGKKMSMYEKWMSKGSLFKRDQPKETRASGTASQYPRADNLPYQQAARKEKDDRDLLQQVVTIIQDCNKEVQTTLGAVKDKINSESETSSEKTSEMLKAFLEDIWKHEDRMLHAVEESNQNANKITELEKKLALKDAEIQQLQSQLKGQDKQDLKLVAKAVRQEMMSPQVVVENKLQEILDVTRETSEQQSRQMDQYKQQMTMYTKKHNELKTANQKLIKDTEKRLQKEISGLRTSLQQQEEEWQSKLHEQLTEANGTYSQNIERLLDQILAQTSSRTAGSSSRQGQDSGTQAAISNLKKEIHSALQKQVKTVEQGVQELLGQQSQCQQEQLHLLQTSLLSDVAACIQSMLEQQKEESVTPLTLPEFEEKFEEYHKDVKQQLQDLHQKHVQEVLRLQREMENQGANFTTSTSSAVMPFLHCQYQAEASDEMLRKSQDRTLKQAGYQLQSGTGMAGAPNSIAPSASTMCKPFPNTREDVGRFQFQEENTDHGAENKKSYKPRAPAFRLQPGKGVARISLMSKQEKASLFSKSKPSPVVAVLPQKQPPKSAGCLSAGIRESQLGSSVASTTASREDTTVSTRQPQDQSAVKGEKQGKTSQRKRKRPAPKTTMGKKRSSGKKQAPDQESEAVIQMNTVKHVALQSARVLRGRDIANKTAACFSQASRPDAYQWKYNTLSSEEDQICSPGQVSNASHLSSPAMSVTEVVMVRRSRWQNRSGSLQHNTHTVSENTEVLDILSTPYFLGNPASGPVQQRHLPQKDKGIKRELR